MNQCMEKMGMAPFGPKKNGGPPNRMARRNYEEIIKGAGIHNFSIQQSDDGMWIRMWK